MMSYDKKSLDRQFDAACKKAIDSANMALEKAAMMAIKKTKASTNLNFDEVELFPFSSTGKDIALNTNDEYSSLVIQSILLNTIQDDFANELNKVLKED